MMGEERLDETVKSGPTTVSDGVWHAERVVASPDGARAAWVVTKTTAGDGEQAGVWSAPIGESPLRLSDEVPETNLAFDPPGTRIAFAVMTEGLAEIVVVDLVTGSDRRRPISGVPEILCWSDNALLVLVAEEGACILLPDTRQIENAVGLARGRVGQRAQERRPLGQLFGIFEFQVALGHLVHVIGVEEQGADQHPAQGQAR